MKSQSKKNKSQSKKNIHYPCLMKSEIGCIAFLDSPTTGMLLFDPNVSNSIPFYSTKFGLGWTPLSLKESVTFVNHRRMILNS